MYVISPENRSIHLRWATVCRSSQVNGGPTQLVPAMELPIVSSTVRFLSEPTSASHQNCG